MVGRIEPVRAVALAERVFQKRSRDFDEFGRVDGIALTQGQSPKRIIHHAVHLFEHGREELVIPCLHGRADEINDLLIAEGATN